MANAMSAEGRKDSAGVIERLSDGELVYKIDERTTQSDFTKLSAHHQDSQQCNSLRSAGAYLHRQSQNWVLLSRPSQETVIFCPVLQAIFAAAWLVSCYALRQSKGLGHGCCLHSGVALSRLLALHHNQMLSTETTIQSAAHAEVGGCTEVLFSYFLPQHSCANAVCFLENSNVP